MGDQTAVIDLMEPNKRQRMMDQYNETATHYDYRYRKIQFLKLALLYSRVPPPHGLVLDYGAGTGLLWEFYCYTQSATQCSVLATALKSPFILFGEDMNWLEGQMDSESIEPRESIHDTLTWLSERHNLSLPRYNLICMDISLEMLRIFRAKTKIAGARTLNGEFFLPHMICADGEFLPFRDERFTSVLAITALQNLENLSKGLFEIKRVLEPNGELGFTFLKKAASKEQLKDMLRILGFALFIPPYLGKDEITIEDWVGHVSKEPEPNKS